MKKILMCLAMVMLLLNLGGHAMAETFTDGHLIRAVYQMNGTNEVLTDLGPFDWTQACSGQLQGGQAFPLPGSTTFPSVQDAKGNDITWSTLQVAYFVKDSAHQLVWVSGPASALGQMNGSRKFGSFEGAANGIFSGALAAGTNVMEFTGAQNDELSYVTLMDNGNPADSAGFMAGFLPNQDGEANLGSIALGDSHVNQYLYYYATPDTASAGVPVAHIMTMADGNTVVDCNFNPVATSFEVVLPSSAVAGTKVTGDVVALDADGYMISDYSGTVTMTNTDPLSTAGKAPAAIKAVKMKNGIGTFSYTPYTMGLQTITATSSDTPPVTGSAEIAIRGNRVIKFIVTPEDTSAVSGTGLNFIVTGYDKYGNVATNYDGTLAFTSSDKLAVFDTTVTTTTSSTGKITKTYTAPLTHGVGTFTVHFLTPSTTGNTIIVTDQTVDPVSGKVKPLGKGTSVKIPTTAAPAVSLTVTNTLTNNTAALVSGKAVVTIDVNAIDANGYPTQVGDTVAITSTDTAGVMPAAAALKKGVGKFAVTLKTGGGIQTTITATDTTNSSATPGTTTVTVN